MTPDYWGSTAVAAILAWSTRSVEAGTVELVPSLVATLRERGQLLAPLVARGAVEGPGLKVCSALLDARVFWVRLLGSPAWVAAVRTGLSLRDPELELHSCVFLASVALSSANEAGAELLVAAFSTLYEATRRGLLRDELWHMIEHELPWSFLEWDRCARLVRGAASAFVDHRWETRLFVRTFSAEEQLLRAIEDARSTSSGRRYLRDVLRAHESGDVALGRRAEGVLRELSEQS